eukprot:GHVT01010292.1.p1 GENE.GHVT01010292.1~~GHVT01010292.1.p1  ORF type:complete len:199 (-),score=17.82 GHVT01010292.1:296-892(-)
MITVANFAAVRVPLTLAIPPWNFRAPSSFLFGLPPARFAFIDRGSLRRGSAISPPASPGRRACGRGAGSLSKGGRGRRQASSELQWSAYASWEWRSLWAQGIVINFCVNGRSYLRLLSLLRFLASTSPEQHYSNHEKHTLLFFVIPSNDLIMNSTAFSTAGTTGFKRQSLPSCWNCSQSGAQLASQGSSTTSPVFLSR